MFDRQLVKLSQTLGGCERIASTPVPFGNAVVIHRVVYFYCALLPFGLVDRIAWMTPVVTLVMAYSFIALDLSARELEMPFGRNENDLALDAISLNIELSIREMSAGRIMLVAVWTVPQGECGGDRAFLEPQVNCHLPL